MATVSSNRWKFELLKGTVDGDTDSFKIILMGTGFIFNVVTHGTYTDVLGSELATGSGYTAGGSVLAGQAVTQNDTTNKGRIDFNNVSWIAAGGSIVASGAVIYDDTHASDIVVGYVDFNGDQTTLDGGTFTIANVAVTNS